MPGEEVRSDPLPTVVVAEHPVDLVHGVACRAQLVALRRMRRRL